MGVCQDDVSVDAGATLDCETVCMCLMSTARKNVDVESAARRYLFITRQFRSVKNNVTA